MTNNQIVVESLVAVENLEGVLEETVRRNMFDADLGIEDALNILNEREREKVKQVLKQLLEIL